MMRLTTATAATLSALAVVASGCASSQPELRPLALSPQTAVDNAVADYTGAKTSTVWLRRHIRVAVGTASDPGKARSRVEVSALAANYGAQPKQVTLLVPAPRGATLEKLTSGSVKVTEAPEAAIDPLTTAFRVTGEVAAKGTLEFVAAYDVKGTLTSDVRWLASPDTPTAEFLLSYQFPDHAVGTFNIVNAKGRPLVTKKGGTTIIALMLRNVAPASGPASGYARYATKMATLRGYKQTYAANWPTVLAPYAGEFGGRSVTLRGGTKVPPVRPKATGVEAVKELTLWTRARIQRKDAFDGAWNGGRPLPVIVPKNDLYAVDKIHLLHWLLDAAGLKHRIVVARSKRYPAVTADLAAPGAFDQALIYSEVGGLWLDPACQTCEPGTVRTELQGQQAMMLPPGPAKLMTLPKASTPAAPKATPTVE